MARKTTKKVATPTNEVVEAEPVVETPPVVEEETTETDVAVPTLADAFGDVLNQLSEWRRTITTLTAQVRALRARAEREVKTAQKQSRRRKSNRKPSGFVKPTLISSELAKFLGKPAGTEMARTEVTREINQYIRANQLQDKTNGRIIHPDAKLRKLLKLSKNDELTYFNLQRFMSPHFAKATATTTSAPEETVV